MDKNSNWIKAVHWAIFLNKMQNVVEKLFGYDYAIYQYDPRNIYGYSVTQLPSIDLTIKDEQSISTEVNKEKEEKLDLKDVTKEELEKISSLLPEIKLVKEDDSLFREKSLEPPLKGDKIEQDFPPKLDSIQPKAPKDSKKEKLDKNFEVVKIFPEKVNHINSWMVTFNEQVMDISSYEENGKINFPAIEMSPKIEFTLEWVGTTMLKCNVKEFQKSTKYKVIIKKFKTNTGSLKNDYTFEFITALPRITKMTPNSVQVCDTPIGYVEFDQDIDVDDAFSKAKLTDGGMLSLQWGSYEIKKISVDEVKKLLLERKYINIKGALEYDVDTYNSKKGFFWKSVNPLEKGNKYHFKFAPGIKSKEGDLATTESIGYYFQVYKELTPTLGKVYDHRNWIYVYFNYNLDLNVVKDDMITVKPKIENLQISVYDTYIQLLGELVPNETYEIELSPKICDIWGRKLETTKLVHKNGPTPSTLFSPFQRIVTFDASKGECYMPVFTKNLNEIHYVIFEVDPRKDFDKSPLGPKYVYPTYGQSLLSAIVVGKKVAEDTIKLPTKKDEFVETKILLGKYLKKNLGNLFVFVEVPNKYQPLYCWIQSTNLSIDTFQTRNKMYCWTNNIKDGSLVKGATLTCQYRDHNFDFGKEQQIELNEKGFADFEPKTGTYRLFSKVGDDEVFYSHSINTYEDPSFKFHVFDDRNLYQPKEMITIKGYIRDYSENEGEVIVKPTKDFELNYEVKDSRHAIYQNGKCQVKNGAFDITFKIPDSVNLGMSHIYFSFGSYHHTHYFKVEEFRTPEFQVNLSNESNKDLLLSDPILLNGKATYFNGGCIDDSVTHWEFQYSKGSYFPPGWDGYSFNNDSELIVPPYPINHISKTNVYGENLINVSLTKKKDAVISSPFNISSKLFVTDFNNIKQESSTSVLVHPCSLYLGVKSTKIFSIPKEEAPFEFIVTDIQGNAQEKVKFTVEINVRITKRSGYNYTTEEKTIKSYDLESTKEPLVLKHSFEEGGIYMIRGKVKDSKGLENMVSFSYRVSGSTKTLVQSNTQEDPITMVSDKEIYQIGDTAEIFIQCNEKLTSHRAILNILCGNHLQREDIELKDSYIAKIKITKAFLPNALLSCYIIGESNGEAYYGLQNLEIKTTTLIHQLDVNLKTQSYEHNPGSTFDLDIEVKDSNNSPCSDANVTLLVVDEAVLSLSGYTLKNPIDTFYYIRNYTLQLSTNRDQLKSLNTKEILDQYTSPKQGRISSFSNLKMDDLSKNALYDQSVRYEDEELMECEQAQPKSASYFGGSLFSTRMRKASESVQQTSLDSSGGAPSNAPSRKPISVRSQFDPSGTFVSLIKTDKDGKLTHSMKLPQSLTKFRIMAFVTNDIGTAFGIKETYVATRLPFQIRPTLPKFLNVGDKKVQIPVIFQNQSDESMTIKVLFKTVNLKVDHDSHKFSIPSKQRVVIPFTVETISPGKAYIQVGAISEDEKYEDAFEKTIEVYVPATPSAMALYKEIDDDDLVIHKISTPQNVYEQYGGLEITTSSTALQVLTDAFFYVYNYDIEFTESIASQIISIVALKDILHEFKAKDIPTKTEIEEYVEKSIEKLQKSQKSDGGWSNWSPLLPTDPFLSGIVIYALILAEKSGFNVPKKMYDLAYQYITNIERNWIFALGMLILPDTLKNTIKAFCYYLQSLIKADDNLLKKCTEIFKASVESKKIFPEGLSWLMIAIHNCKPGSEMIQKILSMLKSTIHETPKTANFITEVSENEKYMFLHSNIRTDAIVLEGLLTVDSKNYLIPKIVKGLLEGRTKGRWSSTQENMFVILSLKKYFDLFEKQTPDYKNQLWLHDIYLGEQEFKGRSVDYKNISIPMNFLSQQNQSLNLIIQKKGKGRLYYRIGMKSASKDLTSKSENHGFILFREYSPVQNKDDVVKDSDGVWRIKVGSEVKVSIKMVVTSKRYNIALIDKVAGGFEPLKSKEKYTQFNFNAPRYSNGWFQHQNLRSERVEAFSNFLPEGIYHYSYVSKATFKGEYKVPPCYAEEIYSPEIYGRSLSNVVIIE